MYYNSLFMFAPVLLMAWQAGDVAAALQFQGKYFKSTSALTHALWYTLIIVYKGWPIRDD